MAVSITVRNVPDRVRDELAARAAGSGRSLQEYLRAHLEQVAATPDVDTVIRRVRERAHAAGTTLTTAEILDAVQADRR